MNDDISVGGCQCGSVRYEFSGNPQKIYICHCAECRKQSASAFGISVAVARTAFRVTQGRPAMWSRATDSGNTLDCMFCTTCGSRLWHQRRGTGETLSVKGGSLDAPVDLRGALHIWTARVLPGVVIPEDATRFAGEPR